MPNRRTISRDAASDPDIHAQIGPLLLTPLNENDLVTVQNTETSGFVNRTDEGAQLWLRDRSQVHASNRVEAEFKRLERQTVLLRVGLALQVAKHNQRLEQPKHGPAVQACKAGDFAEPELRLFG